MKKKSFILVLFLLIFFHRANADYVDVRIFTSKVITTFIFSPLGCTYSIYGNGRLLVDCDPSGIFQMNIEGDSIRLKTFERDLGKFSVINMVAKQSYSAFKIKSVLPQTKVRTYDDDLEITLTPDKKQFLLINKVNLENYIAGVVGSEAGKGNSLEYYKLQAILCRTYLLTHINRHILEGFQVCDDVHCQAYFNRASEDNILKAVFTTKGLVVVDNNLNLITTAFHANCGGETCNSEDVWAMTTTYLKSVKDIYCQKQLQARWERAISLEDWNEYLQLKHKTAGLDNRNYTATTFFSQASGRVINFTDQDLTIPLKTIRADFKLKSTYFSIDKVGDAILFKGRGYGHGVGLCQEGAMQMSKLKYSYEDILHYYYKDVHLVDLSSLDYFNQE